MRISDWSSDVCSSDLDVACLMIAALTVQDRRSAERHLLQHYLGDLAARGIDGQLPFHMLWDRYRRWPLWGMVSSLADADRSEEHTSELQSLMRISYAVFCLTKKNLHTLYIHSHTTPFY